ncbi:hypothetical protein L484_023459 [Morus notabilis]|uniref:Uncharacterized protein n=1 Tax=Morus notabilis TaxID=981085 RepID=W9RLG9_9ROSA|nr:hypothetical protein L484_023459 [Morus notabilis]
MAEGRQVSSESGTQLGCSFAYGCVCCMHESVFKGATELGESLRAGNSSYKGISDNYKENVL